MKIGDKVVCVDDSPCVNCGKKTLIVNNVYVVEATQIHPLYQELEIRVLGANHEPPNCRAFWRGDRFRLLDELKAEAAKRQHQTA